MTNFLKLQGQVALVSGAAQGSGQATTLLLAAVTQTVATWGRLDIVVNNAYWSQPGTVIELAEAESPATPFAPMAA